MLSCKRPLPVQKIRIYRPADRQTRKDHILSDLINWVTNSNILCVTRIKLMGKNINTIHKIKLLKTHLLLHCYCVLVQQLFQYDISLRIAQIKKVKSFFMCEVGISIFFALSLNILQALWQLCGNCVCPNSEVYTAWSFITLRVKSRCLWRL